LGASGPLQWLNKAKSASYAAANRRSLRLFNRFNRGGTRFNLRLSSVASIAGEAEDEMPGGQQIDRRPACTGTAGICGLVEALPVASFAVATISFGASA
jgi:hypothetical protein